MEKSAKYEFTTNEDIDRTIRNDKLSEERLFDSDSARETSASNEKIVRMSRIANAEVELLRLTVK